MLITYAHTGSTTPDAAPLDSARTLIAARRYTRAVSASCASEPAFAGVLLDWRGTLVVAPTWRRLTAVSLERLGRAADAASVDAVLDCLRVVDSTRVNSSAIDTDVDEHRDAYTEFFSTAGLDEELAAMMYACESEAGLNPFAVDVEPLLTTLADAGVRIGVLSDIHFDLRPTFASHRLADGRTWADLVTAWVLSYETGVAKPDPAAFEVALERLGLPAEQVLMVGDRGPWDGAAAEVGMTTLILPPLTSIADARLHRVVDLTLPRAEPQSPAERPLAHRRR